VPESQARVVALLLLPPLLPPLQHLLLLEVHVRKLASSQLRKKPLHHLVSQTMSRGHVTILTIVLATPTVPAKLAQECLSSVPLAKDAALALVDSIEPYLEWQSGT
jgi:hypothetical protein